MTFVAIKFPARRNETEVEDDFRFLLGGTSQSIPTTFQLLCLAVGRDGVEIIHGGDIAADITVFYRDPHELQCEPQEHIPPARSILHEVRAINPPRGVRLEHVGSYLCSQHHVASVHAKPPGISMWGIRGRTHAERGQSLIHKHNGTRDVTSPR